MTNWKPWLAAGTDSSGGRKYSAPVVALLLTAGLRVLYTAFAALLSPYLSALPVLIRSNSYTEHLMNPAEGAAYSLLGVWERFDTLNYLHIAQFGYDKSSLVVFFPLYPLMIRLLTPVMRSALLASLAIATVSAFFVFWGLFELIRLDFSDEIAFRAVVFYALWPASFIWFCGYAEPVVMALMIWSIYFARTGKWWLSALLGFMAPLAKAVGILLLAPLGILALRERGWKRMWAIAPLVGGAAYPLWLAFSGRLLPWDSYGVYWGTQTTWPWITVFHCAQTALRFLYLGDARNTVDVMLKVGSALFYLSELAWVLIVFVLALSKKIRLEYLLFTLAAIYLFLMKDSTVVQQQWTRYVLILFPAAIAFALREKDRVIFAGFTTLGFAFNLLLLWFFLQWMLVV